MVETPFDLKAAETVNPRPKDLPDDEPWNPLTPRKEVRDAFKQVDFKYDPTVHDKSSNIWYSAVNRDPNTTQEVVQICRRRIPLQGEFITANIILRGKDWKGNQHDMEHIIGKYELPTFKLEKDMETEKVTSTQVLDRKEVFDIPWSKETFDKLIKSAAEPLHLVVYGSAGRRYGLPHLTTDDFREADYDDLIACGDKGKSLQTVKAERNQFTYEKKEQKPTK